jgi:NADH-quinone oxidoreductase subunit G
VPLYAVDAIVRRSVPLQTTADALPAAVYVHENVAKELGIAEGRPVTVRQAGCELALDLVIDNRVALGCAWIPAGVAGSTGLGAHGSAIELIQG